MHKRAFSRVTPLRAKLFFYLCFAIALYLVWRLYDVQVLRGPVFARAALSQRTRLVTISGHRGSILDRDGNALVRSLPSESIYVDPQEVENFPEVTAKLRAVVGPLDSQTIALMHSPGEQFVYIARKVPHDVAQRVVALDLSGVFVQPESARSRRRSSATSASTKTASRASSIHMMTCCAASSAGCSCKKTSWGGRFRSPASASSSRRRTGSISS
jgi:cell division protein FtsI/penicillin-binding protein 2